jgi:hypothetical protein
MTTPASPTTAGDENAPAAPPLHEDERRRGRRITIGSHPLGMTFAMVFGQHLPTLALVSLGASETLLGLQSAFVATDLLKLWVLRTVARFSKRSILVFGQVAALGFGVPLIFFPELHALSDAGRSSGVWIALASLFFVTAAMKISETVWFPMLRSYVEPARIGRFFGQIRSGWHFALIFYYLGARWWLAQHPDDFGPLFALAWLFGLLRVFAIVRLPERSERTGERIRIREAARLVRTNPLLRSYLAGATAAAAIRLSVLPFSLVMLQREIGFDAGHVLYTTVASFAGGLASLYLWGRAVDRLGPRFVFRTTCLGLGVLTSGLVAVQSPGDTTLALMVGFFFLYSVLSAGFGVADTHVLFELTPPEAPARTLVIAAVVVNGFASLAPIASGIALDHFLEHADSRIVVYHGFFALAAVLQLLVYRPLRAFS